MHYTVTRTYEFAAAHSLPAMPEGHKCRDLHGHTYRMDVTVKGNPDDFTGLFIDFYELDRVVEHFVLKDILDHTHLNHVEGLENPTTENLCLWVWKALKRVLPGLEEISISEDSFSRVTLKR